MFPQATLERTKGPSSGNLQAEKARLQKATREFESFFMYYMLKTMRKTVPESSLSDNSFLGGSSGKETFTDIFDMEIARSVTQSTRGSIGDILYKSLEKVLESQFTESAPVPQFIPVHKQETQKLELEKPGLSLPDKKEGLKPLEKKLDSLPFGAGHRRVDEDPIMSRFGRHIDNAARETKLDSALIASVIKAESAGDPRAVSSAGAKGLMQLADSTATDYGVVDVFNPEENILAGSRFLKNLIDRYGDLETALAAYNAGPGRVDKYGGIPPFKETRAYIRKVTDLFRAAKVKIKAPRG